MALIDVNRKKYRLEFLTDSYLMQCVAEPVGVLMSHLDPPDRETIFVKDITMISLDTVSSLDTLKINELWVRRDDVIAIRANEDDLEGALPKLAAREKLRLFTPRYIFQGTVTRGEDTRLGDMFEVMKGCWAPIINAQVFPLVRLKKQIFSKVPYLLLNKHLIRYYSKTETKSRN